MKRRTAIRQVILGMVQQPTVLLAHAKPVEYAALLFDGMVPAIVLSRATRGLCTADELIRALKHLVKQNYIVIGKYEDTFEIVWASVEGRG